MHIILGGTGHVGSALAETLLSRGEPVTVVTRDAAHAESLRRKGAEVAEADVLDTPALRRALRSGRRAFLLNPTADTAGDADAQERRTIAAILAALEDSGLEKVVAESTSGAQPGKDIGDLGALLRANDRDHRRRHRVARTIAALPHDVARVLRGRGAAAFDVTACFRIQASDFRRLIATNASWAGLVNPVCVQPLRTAARGSDCHPPHHAGRPGRIR